jgi:pimeloyl-ACP methyl ester carboxylesterase
MPNLNLTRIMTHFNFTRLQTAYKRAAQNVPNCTVKVVPDTGHMMHHDKPEELAGMVEAFVV